MRFEWDPAKARINWRKHGVSFDEASTVFEDAGAMLRFDHDHSLNEDRFVLAGYSRLARFLMVSHSYHDDGSVRIISARKALSHERMQVRR